uniref:methenyltetrahydrofolate cyclohydrolase n=1 Tax=Glossina brevipalpis TaxID=37001 RepID=A0A1A9WFP9_9MUSC
MNKISEFEKPLGNIITWFLSMAEIIDGKAVAAQIGDEIRQDIEEFVKKGNRKPHLTAILVGEDPASQIYVKNKMKTAAAVGITSCNKSLPGDISEKELLDVIDELNNDPNVDGILVQLPVPKHINERNVCNAVAREKDVDGFSVYNVGRMCLDMDSLMPATPLGVIELIKRSNIETFGKNAVVIGRSKNVGMPIAICNGNNFTIKINK